jgi:hypothetical protein
MQVSFVTQDIAATPTLATRPSSGNGCPVLPNPEFVLSDTTMKLILEETSPRRWRQVKAGSFVAYAVEVIEKGRVDAVHPDGPSPGLRDAAGLGDPRREFQGGGPQ